MRAPSFSRGLNSFQFFSKPFPLASETETGSGSRRNKIENPNPPRNAGHFFNN